MMTLARTAPAPLATRSRPWLDPSLYPFSPRRFETEGHALSYVDEGRGAPILFVHGTPSWSFEWRHAMAALRGSRRVVAPDHLGFGLSDKPPDAAYRPADHARRLLALVRALDLTDLTLVVHDFGGPIGLPVAIEEPERVRSIVILNTWMWAHGGDPRVARLSRFVASPLGRFLYTWLDASPRWLVPMSFGDRRKLTREVHRHYRGPFGSRRERVAPWTLGKELAGSDEHYASLWARRDRIASLPATILWGMRDPAFGPSYLARWRELYPEARVVELAEAGHFPQEEAPDALLEALRGA